MTATQDRAEYAPASPRAPRSGLESISIKRRTTGEAAAARSRMVRRLRIAFPIVALGLLAAFLLNMTGNEVDDAFLDDFKSLDAAPEELEMASPRFAGVDAHGKPFEITAAGATRRPEDDAIVMLDRPRAVTDAADERSVVTAAKGRFQSDEKVLELSEGVEMRHSVGTDTYVLRTPAATVLIDEQRVESVSGVAGEGPGGDTLIADRMTAYQDEDRVVFEGNVRMKIHDATDALTDDAKPANEDAAQ